MNSALPAYHQLAQFPLPRHSQLQVCTGRVIHRTMLSLGLTFNLRQSPSKVRLFIKLILETRPCVDLEVIYDYV